MKIKCDFNLTGSFHQVYSSIGVVANILGFEKFSKQNIKSQDLVTAIKLYPGASKRSDTLVKAPGSRT